jgi:ribosome-associated translation inhibitor RaiA
MVATEVLMETPLQITFHRMDPSPALESDVRARFQELQNVFDRVVNGRVLLDLPHQHQTHGRRYHVRVEISVPGQHLVASESHDGDPRHEDPYVAVADAFRVARRQLEEYARRHQDVRRTSAL